jgi:diguanylate cyclase (GGDEF)-like protein/PAS domain S-box-containing protein
MTASRHASLAIADLLDILPDAVVMVDAASCISYVNPAVQSLLGYAPAELIAQPLTLLVPPEHRERHDVLVARYRREGAPMMMGARPVLHAVHRSGRLLPVSISLCNFSLDGSESGRVSVAVIHDVSALHTHLDRATARAETDALTGLGNRLRLSRRMQALLSAARPFALLFLDLERFKQLNDRHGHEVGDEALRVVGQRLRRQVRELDLIARLGGDEFVMLFDGLEDPAHLQERALAVAHSIGQPLRLDAATGALGVNIGGAMSPRHGRGEAALLHAADQAMYRAKQAGAAYRLADES